MKATGARIHAIRRMLYRMVQAGLLHKEPGRKYGSRFFATLDAAAAFQAANKAPDCPNPEGNLELGEYRKAHVKKVKALAAVSPHWKEKKYTAPKPVPREAVVTSETRITICPSAPVFSRHQVAPGDPIPSVISARECSSWARTVWGTP
jgi:hypothetical protein